MRKSSIALVLFSFPITAHAQNAVDDFRRNMMGNLAGYDQGHIPSSKTDNQAPPDNGGVYLKHALDVPTTPNAVTQAPVVGLTIGMPAVEAEKILGRYCNHPAGIKYQTLGLSYKGIDVKTQPFVSKLTCSSDNDSLSVDISPPVAGTTVTKIDREVSYPADKSPHFADFQAEILKKYNIHLPVAMPNQPAIVAQYILKDKTTSEKINGRPIDIDDTSDAFSQTVQSYLRITANVIPENPTSMSEFTISSANPGDATVISNEIIKQLKAFVDEKLSNSNVKTVL
ncbi:hypothetical protein [Acetobacter orleanensis]|nr:hypothetical protein [Acetobacter orleanensis]